SDNTIGGTASNAGNLISGNRFYGIEIADATATGNLVQGNRVGIDLSGTVALGNASIGVYLVGAPGNTVGGSVAGAGNLIVGSGSDGVQIYGASNSVLQGNWIGTDSLGSANLHNAGSGVQITSGSVGCTI